MIYPVITTDEVTIHGTTRYKFVVHHRGHLWAARSVRTWPTRRAALAAGRKEYPAEPRVLHATNLTGTTYHEEEGCG